MSVLFVTLDGEGEHFRELNAVITHNAPTNITSPAANTNRVCSPGHAIDRKDSDTLTVGRCIRDAGKMS